MLVNTTPTVFSGWIILKPRIVTHGIKLWVKAGILYSSFPNSYAPFSNICLCLYIANSCEHNSCYSFQWI